MSLVELVKKHFYCPDDVACTKCEKYRLRLFDKAVDCGEYVFGRCKVREQEIGLNIIGNVMVKVPTKIMVKLCEAMNK